MTKQEHKEHRRLAAIAENTRRGADAAADALRAWERAYLLSHPLDPQLLVDAVRAGQALCCDKGRARLADLLPDEPLWANVINGWYYAHAGCRDNVEAPGTVAIRLARALGDRTAIQEYFGEAEPS